MYCAKCGTECLPEFKFCKSCGAPVGANGSSPSATVTTPQMSPQVAANVQAAAPYQVPPAQAPAPPPGMVPGLYQAYPGGPQQVYYVPAQNVQAHARAGFLESLQSRIRDLASTDKLEGFSLGQTFSETFKRHGVDAVEEYMMVGSTRSTPPIDVVETGWPKPWMFFRLLMLFVIAFVVLYVVWKFTANTPLVPAIMIMGAFAVPLATLVLLFEMNTPRNVSLVLVGKLFVMGGLAALCAVSFEYMLAIAGKVPGIVEETAKLAAVLLVVRSTRYKYELNGILFGAAVGAGFASFETSFYGLVNAFLPTLIQGLQQMQAPQAINAAMQSMVDNLVVRGVLAPFGHVAWTAIEAGPADEPIDAAGHALPESIRDSCGDAYALGRIGHLPESEHSREYLPLDRHGSDHVVCAVRIDPAGPAPGEGHAAGATAKHTGSRGSGDPAT